MASYKTGMEARDVQATALAAAEHARLEALLGYDVLDTAPEDAFDRLTTLAADLFDAPIAVVSLIDAERQWFKSRFGLDATETPRDVAFCHHAIAGAPNSLFVVPDATRDDRFRENPQVTGDPNVRFYAGATLTTPDGHNLGTLCVIDDTPRPAPTERDLKRLQTLAGIVVEELELRRANRALARRKQWLDLAGAMSGVGSWRLRVADMKAEWSDEVYAIHGVEKDGFNPGLDDALVYYPAEHRARITDHLEHALATGEGYEFRAPLLRADGALRQVICKAECERDDTGQIVAVVGVFQDITDSERALRQVSSSEARFRLLADHTTDLTLRLPLNDPEHRLLYASPSVRALGYEPEEIVGRRRSDFIHPDDIAQVHRAVVAQLGGAPAGPVQDNELRVRTKDGAYIWMESRPSIVHDDAGAPVEVVSVLRDISARKALEAELARAVEAAEAAAAVKSEFLANMSHELRTPLTSVLGFTRLALEQDDLSAETRGYITKSGNAGASLLTTVNDILDFSTLEAGQVEIRPRAADPEAVCRETLELFSERAADKGLVLDLKTRHLPAALVFDPDRLRQLLLNLVGNAVKFSDAGTVTLSVAWAGDTLKVRVADNGPGLSPDQQERLFKRFSQVDGSSTRRHGGTGLGLAICRGLVEAMGGEIGVDSAPGLGAQFHFTLPAPLAAAAAPAPSAAKAPILPGTRVLVADDHPANRELVRAVLGAFGAQVTEAADGAQAVSLAAQAPFDIILMDLRMPVMDGRDAVRAIRQGGGLNATVPVLAFSAGIDIGSAEAHKAAGFDGDLSKPVLPAALIAAVSRHTRWDEDQQDAHAA